MKVLIDDLTTLEASIGQISVDEAARRVKRLKGDAEMLLENVRDTDDRREIEAELDRFTDILPDKYPHRREKIPDDAAIAGAGVKAVRLGQHESGGAHGGRRRGLDPCRQVAGVVPGIYFGRGPR